MTLRQVYFSRLAGVCLIAGRFYSFDVERQSAAFAYHSFSSLIYRDRGIAIYNMKIYIQYNAMGLPSSHNFYIAEQGFQELGFSTEHFSTPEELADCREDDLIVGGIGAVRGKLAALGIEPPSLDYPAELAQYLGRHVWCTTLDQILSETENRPVFVKPVREKRFTGVLLRTPNDCPKLSYCEPEEPVFCSEPVEFSREWRVFVRYGNVLDVRPYKGDWRYNYDSAVVERAVEDFASEPAGYVLDFGVTADGRTLLVEVNDGYSVGSYGLAALDYAKLLSARWCELTGIHDECDIFFEKYEWLKRRGEMRPNG